MRLVGKFGGQVGEVGAMHAGPGRIAALGHEPRNHAMELHPVVEALVRQSRNPLDMLGREVGPKPNDDVAAT